MIQVETADATTFDCDVLVLKYARAHYGVDKVVAETLAERAQVTGDDTTPQPGETRLLASLGSIGARDVLFVGVEPLRKFGYPEIRIFARQALETLAHERPEARRVAFTMHGTGYGLDEREAFDSLVAGLVDAVERDEIPEALGTISIVERDAGTAQRLESYLAGLLPTDRVVTTGSNRALSHSSSERLRAAGYAANTKEHVFVAMPFADEMSDLYHYGIQGAVNAAGYLCERADLTAFTGDVMTHVFDRIATASLIVAELTGANPNVYLEVGYAWGRRVPTILLVNTAEHLGFDVRGQRCLTYGTIRELEQMLRTELENLQLSNSQ